MKPFDIPTLDESLRRDYESGKITAHDVAVELYRHNWYNFIPDENEALRRIGVTQADTMALMELPKCPTHGTPMHYRVPLTPEQRFCGTWYDCDTPGCKCSTLLPSKELLAHNAALRSRSKV